MIAKSRTPFLRGTSFLVGALLLAGCDASRGTGDADLRQAVRDAGSGGSVEMAHSVHGSAIRFDIHHEALGHAIAMSPAVRAARMRLDEGSALMAELRSGSRTQLTASATAGGVAELEGSGDRRAGGGLEMNASRLLYDGGRLAARVDAAGARRIGQEAEVLAIASETGRDAALAWIAVWQARSRLALLGESLTRARPLLAQVEEVIAAGALDRTAGLSLRRRMLDIEAREAELRSDLRVALREFERFFGTLPPGDLAAPGALSTPADLERIVARLDSAPRIVLAAAEIVASDRDLSAARAEARPVVRAGARLSNPLTARSEPEVGIGLTLEHDFGGRGRTQARIAAAESRLEESRSRFEELRGSLGVALGGAFERLTSLRGTAASLDGQLVARHCR